MHHEIQYKKNLINVLLKYTPLINVLLKYSFKFTLVQFCERGMSISTISCPTVAGAMHRVIEVLIPFKNPFVAFQAHTTALYFPLVHTFYWGRTMKSMGVAQV